MGILNAIYIYMVSDWVVPGYKLENSWKTVWKMMLVTFCTLSIICTRIFTILHELQWMTEVVERLLENDTFWYWNACSILFESSINFLIPPPPPSPNSMLCRCWVCAVWEIKKSTLFQGEGGEMFQRHSNIEFYCQVSLLKHFSCPL